MSGVEDDDTLTIVRLQCVVRAFLASKKAKGRVRKFVFRTKVVLEIESTEANYLRDLQLLKSAFYEPMKLMLPKQDIKHIFLNLKQLIELHEQLDAAIKDARQDWNYNSTFVSAFLPLLDKFKIYQLYIDNFGNSTNLVKEQIGTSKEIAEFLSKQSHQPACNKRTLEDFLIMPVQRIPRYLLLMKELAKHTEPGHPDEVNIATSIIKFQEVLSFLNDSRRKVDNLEKISSIVQSVVDLDQTLIIERRFVYDGPLITVSLAFSAKDAKASLPVGNNPLEKLWGLIGKEEIYVYLFEDMMLCAKKIKKTTDPKLLFANKLLAYKYNVMKIVPLFGENCAHPVPDQEAAFRLESDPSRIYICPSSLIRDTWVKKINQRTLKEGS